MPAQDVTVSSYAVGWLERLRGAVAESTRASYRTVVCGYITGSPLGAMAVAAVRPQDVRDFLIGQRRYGWAAGFVRLMQTVLAGIFHDAVERGLVEANPAARLWRRIPSELRVNRDPTQHTPPDGVAMAILAHLRIAHPSLARVVAVYCATGCRRNEAIGLQADDVNLSDHVVTFARQWYGAGRTGPPKGRRSRTVDVSASLEAVLRDAIADADPIGSGRERWLFRSPYTGVPWNPGHVTRVVRAASQAVCGTRFGPKAFRHAVATALLHRGEPPRYVQLLLGHASITTTMGYVAFRAIRRRRAVNGLDKL